jgi:hypothetical protein
MPPTQIVSRKIMENMDENFVIIGISAGSTTIEIE